MHFYVIQSWVLLRNNRLITLFSAIFIFNFLLMPCAGFSIDPNGGINLSLEPSPVNDNVPANDSFSHTVLLSYSKETFKENPISSFMYFVPLISPTAVDRETSAENEQQIGIISYRRKITSKSFSVICEFEILGKGFHKNTFDPAGMMAIFIEELKKGETLTNMLDYIQFEGEGFGRIEVKGVVDDSIQTVTEVNMQFNAKGRKSPVTIGLYDVKPRDGQYTYENRSNVAVARVNSLVFKKSEKNPRMGIKVASVSKSPDSEGFWAGIRGAVANLLIRPPKVDKLGNDTMLEFGYALLKQKPEFAFPKAKNIRENRIVVMDSEKNKSQ
jgi:hypothetical protein